MKKLLGIVVLGFLLSGCYSDTYVSYDPTPKYKSASLGKLSFNAIAYHYTGQYKRYSGIGATKDLAQSSALDNCYRKHPSSSNFCNVSIQSPCNIFMSIFLFPFITTYTITSLIFIFYNQK